MTNWSSLKPLLLLALLYHPAAAFGQTQTVVRHYFTSGTGFFVSNNGDIITNAHVVEGCSTVDIVGAAPNMKGKVKAVDAAHDLALISTDSYVPYAATIREVSDPLRAGEKVVVMGFPGDNAISGKFKTVEAQLLGTSGLLGEQGFLQFTNAADHGNSGGPLLDGSGNVIGVIVSKGRLQRFNPMTAQNETIKEADLAISLSVLTQFLQQNGTLYRSASTSLSLLTYRIENTGQDFIINVRCPQKKP